jgi:hypothetical protein
MVLDWPPTVTTTETLLAETPGGTLQRSMVWSWYVTVHGALPSRITVMPSLGPPKLSPVASQWISPSQWMLPSQWISPSQWMLPTKRRCPRYDDKKSTTKSIKGLIQRQAMKATSRKSVRATTATGMLCYKHQLHSVQEMGQALAASMAPQSVGLTRTWTL